MKAALIFSLLFLLLIACPAHLSAQVPEIGETTVQPAPEIKRLFSALAGDWDTHENRERTQLFPDGGEGRGRTHVRLGAGGAMLMMEGQSDGSAGPLRYLIVVWWDNNAQLYRYFTCFKGMQSGCEVRGTAHWETNDFVNDYEEEVDGKKLKFRDTYREIAPNSHKLVLAWVKDDGSTEPLIITQAVRHGQSTHHRPAR
jgi:hypothetical protein